MSHEGLRTWPPIWVCVYGASQPIEHNEIGTLTEMRILDQGDSRIMLRMKNHNGEYLTLIYFDDCRFCRRVYERMKHYIGKPIKDAGDLEFETP